MVYNSMDLCYLVNSTRSYWHLRLCWTPYSEGDLAEQQAVGLPPDQFYHWHLVVVLDEGWLLW